MNLALNRDIFNLARIEYHHGRVFGDLRVGTGLSIIFFTYIGFFLIIISDPIQH